MDSERMKAEVDHLLSRINAGEREALDELLPLVYQTLHGMARKNLGPQAHQHTLQPTALVNEFMIRICGSNTTWADRKHFLTVASMAMRRILVDHSRYKDTEKRTPPGERVPLDEALEEYEQRAIDLSAVHDCLEQLHSEDPELAELIDLRFFGGQSIEQIALMREKSERQTRRDWVKAKTKLRKKLA